MVNRQSFPSYQIKDKKVVASLVKDLHLNKTSKKDPHFELFL